MSSIAAMHGQRRRGTEIRQAICELLEKSKTPLTAYDIHGKLWRLGTLDRIRRTLWDLAKTDVIATTPKEYPGQEARYAARPK